MSIIKGSNTLKGILFASILFLVLLLIGSFFQVGLFLSAPAATPEKADLIVVLGGDAGARSLTGAKLYCDGYAPRVLLTGLDDGEKAALPYYYHWRSQLLQGKGVDKQAILYDFKSGNSWQEAQNTLKLMKENHWQTALVVSDPPHLRRLDWVWNKTFSGFGCDYRLIAAAPSWWDAHHWWQDERSGKFVVDELIKLAYYRIKY